ncbi:MAG: hypothetical protein ACTHME_00410 [Candidatus Nitrosocosmicus sp.]
MKIKSSKNRFLYIFSICFAFIFIGSAVVFTTSNNMQPAFSQGYIPPPSTAATTHNQIANNINPSTSNTIASSSSGQSQLNQGQQQQPGYNCNTKLMVGCGSINPGNTTTTPIQQQLDNCKHHLTESCFHLGTCPPGFISIAACNLSSTQDTNRQCDPAACTNTTPQNSTTATSSCQTAACAAGGGSADNNRMCDPAACTNTTPQNTTTTACYTAACAAAAGKQLGTCPPDAESIAACNFGKIQAQER